MPEYHINEQYTFLERAKTFPKGSLASTVIDVMDKIGVAEFIKDFPVFPASHGLKHRVQRTTNRPPTTHRNLYAGVKPTIVTKQIIWEPVVQFAARNEIDEDAFAGMSKEDARAERKIQVDGHIKSLQEDYVYSLFNESRASGSEYIDGLGVRLGTLSYPGHSSEVLPYVWDNGGTGSDLCSMYIVELGSRACYGLIPSFKTNEGQNLGISIFSDDHEKTGETDNVTAIFYQLVDYLKQWVGFACADDWKLTRIANIEREVSAAKSFDEDLVIKALAHGKFDERASRIYVGPTLYSQLCIKAKDVAQHALDWDNIFGKKVLTVWGIPVRKLDSTILGHSESALV